ncbi:MAG: hypothetical protein J6T88_01710, partial [Bacteroidales bacterium]|nr:hypothetical protein [Bacteroidales bacterium]
MKNKSLLVILALLFWAVPTEAQRFEWVRGFAPGENVSIVGSVVDSVGNLYILGSINFNTCWENGSRLLPITPSSYAQNNGDAMIAKISPAGDLLWHKVIHGNYTNSIPYDIKLLGDTAFACLIEMPLATWYYYLYYLDTMIQATGSRTDWPDYPMSAQDSYDYAALALITFDFEGNVLEQHFLQMSYLDCNGDDIRYTHPSISNPLISNNRFRNPSFAIDGEGNIYISRWTYDMVSGGPVVGNYSVVDGTISAFKFWCDRREIGIAPAYSNLPTSPQILKFSPHFDTLLNGRYVFQTEDFLSNVIYTHLEIDKNDKLYFLGQIFPGGGVEETIYIDSIHSMSFLLSPRRETEKSFVVRYNRNLTPERLIYLKDTITDTASFMGMIFNRINDIAFDYDSNKVIVSCSPYKSINLRPELNADNSFFLIDGMRTDFHKDAGIIIFDLDDMRLSAYGHMNTENWSHNQYESYGNIACGNNRIFVQTEHYGDIYCANDTIDDTGAPLITTAGLCLNVYDYQGHYIAAIDYKSYSNYNDPGPVCLKDNTLYLINKINVDAMMGDIRVSSRGTYFACIAKLTDPAFMSTYERPRDTTICVEVRQEELTAVHYPNPTTGRLTIEMNGRPLREAYVAAMDGVAQPLPVTALGGSRYAADLTGRPDGTYV